MIEARNGTVTVGGIPARALAGEFGTPLFVYDAEAVRAAYRRVRASIDYAPSRVHYAAVCNPNLHLLSLLRAEGAGVHANTPGDVFCALRAGFAPSDIVFSGSNLGPEDARYLGTAGVHVNVDSLEDLTRMAMCAPGRPVGLRVHLEHVLAESRVGLRESEIPRALSIADDLGVPVTALHVYCGTHGRSLGRYRAAVDRLVALGAELRDLECINVGGGFGYDYDDPDAQTFPFAELGRIVGDALGRLTRHAGREIVLRLEPGRALVAGAGIMLTTVRSSKHGGGKRYVGVDATVANFTSPAVHGARRRVVAVDGGDPAREPADVCGATTYSRDFLARGAELPALAPGDLLAVLDTGAYGYCMASHFLNRPRPAEVFVDGGVARLVTRRETFTDLVRPQIELEAPRA